MSSDVIITTPHHCCHSDQHQNFEKVSKLIWTEVAPPNLGNAQNKVFFFWQGFLKVVFRGKEIGNYSTPLKRWISEILAVRPRDAFSGNLSYRTEIRRKGPLLFLLAAPAFPDLDRLTSVFKRGWRRGQSTWVGRKNAWRRKFWRRRQRRKDQEESLYQEMGLYYGPKTKARRVEVCQAQDEARLTPRAQKVTLLGCDDEALECRRIFPSSSGTSRGTTSPWRRRWPPPRGRGWARWSSSRP